MDILPESSMSMEAPVSAVMALMFLPPGPITSRIFSGLMYTTASCGARGESSGRGAESTSAMRPRIWILASWAWRRAWRMTAWGMPVILMSIWMPVTPSAVPATLKSMSPMASSSPRMSVRTRKSSPSLISPMAMPATGSLMGTPASIRARDAPHTEAMDEEPLDSMTWETTRMVKGNSSGPGRTGTMDRSARAPWPISRREGPRSIFTSPTQ